MLPEADGRFLPSYTRVVVVVVAVVHTGRSGDRQRAVSVLCFLVFGFWCLVLGLVLVLVFGIGVWYWVGVSKKITKIYLSPSFLAKSRETFVPPGLLYQ